MIQNFWNPIFNKLPGSEVASAWTLMGKLTERPGFVPGMQGFCQEHCLFRCLQLSAPFQSADSSPSSDKELFSLLLI